MVCLGCKKNLPSTLSVCPSCGTMIGDSVREELASKVVPIQKLEKPTTNSDSSFPGKVKVEPIAEKASFKMDNSDHLASKNDKDVFPRKVKTSEVNVKSTDPTLVEFQSKTTAVPEWKLRLKNAVRRYLEKHADGIQDRVLSSRVSNDSHDREDLFEKGKNTVEEREAILRRALLRIEESRSRFSCAPELEDISQRKSDVLSFKTNSAGVGEKALKKLEIKTFPIVEKCEETKGFETNKLPPLSEVSEGISKDKAVRFVKSELTKASKFEASASKDESIDDSIEAFVEDYAPLSQRFGAGLFDFIVGVFLSFILLLPFIVLGKGSFSVETFFAFLATIAIVLFVYLTIGIAFFGKTIGMKIFSLEIIDVEENQYPTLHQAAINTIAYLFSLMTCGLGFLPAFFNQERRAVHDLIAGTIVVKELR